MTEDDLEDRIARARECYRPARIAVLFVAETPPSTGKFFYFGKNNMLRQMQRVIEPSITDDKAFLESFKARGWYFDDLVLKPLRSPLTRSEREEICWSAKDSLADRIKIYRPRAIVSLLYSIRHIVECAATKAGAAEACFESVRFPGQGHERRFQEEMKPVLRKLRDLGSL